MDRNIVRDMLKSARGALRSPAATIARKFKRRERIERLRIVAARLSWLVLLTGLRAILETLSDTRFLLLIVGVFLALRGLSLPCAVALFGAALIEALDKLGAHIISPARLHQISMENRERKEELRKALGTVGEGEQ